MKRIVTVLFICIVAAMSLQARDYQVRGPQGGLSFKITLPEGFNAETDRCPMVILMHGIFAGKDKNPMPALAKGLAKAGIASIRFDFNGHGKSEGRMQDMTVEKEIGDAMAVLEYVKTLPYVTQIGFLGHSQGGVIASMSAGRLAAEGSQIPAGLVLLAPGSVIKYACQNGVFFDSTFDPAEPPEYISCWGIRRLGREYLLSTQTLPVYETAAAYQGPVYIMHGDKDHIVPMWCSDCYKEVYGDNAELVVVKGENHLIMFRRDQVVSQSVDFFRTVFNLK